MMHLPDSFLARPIAHRGLHDQSAGREENHFAAFDAAIAQGFGIEVDIQPSKDGVPMVFHDHTLDRLTTSAGPIDRMTQDDLKKVAFRSGPTGIPTLQDLIDHVDGRVPLLIEVKDQDGALGPNVGALEKQIARVLSGYDGDVALMSFNPNSVAALADAAPDIPRGLTTAKFAEEDCQGMPESRRLQLAAIADYDRVGASFVAHQCTDLASPRVRELKANGASILTWTVRSAEVGAKAREIADNLIFEDYIPA